MNMKLMLGASATAFALSTAIASAANINLDQMASSGDALASFQSFETLMGGTRIMENFDGAATPGGNNQTGVPAAVARTTGNSFDAGNLGTFAGADPHTPGAGSTITNGGANIQVRDGDNGGRFNVLSDAGSSLGGEGNFLDSNDTVGFTWTLTNIWGSLFQGLQLFVTDPNDANRNLTVTVRDNNNQQLFQDDIENISGVTGNLASATIWHLTADLRGVDWGSLEIGFDKDGNGDGFAVSNVTAHVIPLPAPALMLLSGLGALGGLSLARRRREAASA